MAKPMVMPRNYQLRSLSGWTGAFRAGKPKPVPEGAWEEAQAAGATFVNAADVPTAEVPKSRKPPAIPPNERKELILEAFEELVERNQRGDFIATGFPNVRAVADITGLVGVTKEEVHPLWTEFNAPVTEG